MKQLVKISSFWSHWRAFAAAGLVACSSPIPGAEAGPTQLTPIGPISAMATPTANAMPIIALTTIATDQQRVTEPWFGLTASDGSGLEITKVEIASVLEGPLAFTELHLHFKNPEARVREGKFRITLPDGAAISRFAMENNGQFMEAEMVEKQLARRAYEDFLHRKQDPALLEQAAGNEFTARVFPIPANGEKHLVVSFSQELANDNFHLPLRGLPTLGSLSARVQVLGADGNRRTTSLAKNNWKPDADVVAQGKTLDAVRAGNLIAMRVPVGTTTDAVTASFTASAVTVLFDTSASRSLGFGNDLKRLQNMVAEIGKRIGAQTTLQVIAFDQTAEQVFAGPIGNFGNNELNVLSKRGALGASDLGAALRLIKAAPNQQVIVVSDAVNTAGADGTELVASIKRLSELGVKRFDVALVGGIRDSGAATALSRALPMAGAVLDIERLGSTEVAKRLGVAMNVNVPVAVANATWVWPRTIAAAQSGDSVIVYARDNGGTASSAAVKMGGVTMQMATTPAAQALLTRSLARADIAELEVQLAAAAIDPVMATTIRKKLIESSIRNRVMSSLTSMLVLESDGDYQRFGIARDALADILAVTDQGVVLQQRKAATLKIASKAPAQKPAAERKSSDSSPSKAAKKLDSSVDFDDQEESLDSAVSQENNKDEARSGHRDADGVADSADAPAAAAAPSRVPQAVTRQEAPSRQTGIRGYVGVGGGGSGQGAANSELATDAPRPMEKLGGPPPLTGELAKITALIASSRLAEATRLAEAWHTKEPGDVIALIALGETSEANRNLVRAARAYGSIIDLFPERADLRRFAGHRLARLSASHQAGVNDLIVDTYRKAVADRPDHPSSHRMLAYALARAGKSAQAVQAIIAGMARDYPDGRFRGVDRILREDLGILAAAAIAAQPANRKQIADLVAAAGGDIATSPSTRFVLYWETDANDVDFHIQDARGGHAFYSDRKLGSGGELFDDVTTGYGPECFAINGKPKAGPYRLSIHYYSMGPMGYGMGAVEVLRHDGKGGLQFETRPYTVMVDQAYVDLGTFE